VSNDKQELALLRSASPYRCPLEGRHAYTCKQGKHMDFSGPLSENMSILPTPPLESESGIRPSRCTHVIPPAIPFTCGESSLSSLASASDTVNSTPSTLLDTFVHWDLVAPWDSTSYAYPSYQNHSRVDHSGPKQG
jgi:hypothetical protein